VNSSIEGAEQENCPNMGTCSHGAGRPLQSRLMRRMLSDHDIESCIERLSRAGEGSLTARELRAELRSRFGYCGNSVRVHGMLKAARPHTRPRIAGTEQSLQDLLEAARAEATHWKQRAELATERERIHQDKWANEIHQLRETVRQLKQAAPSPGLMSDEYLKLYREKARLSDRVAELEEKLATKTRRDK
jgi:hypothetical protein